MDINYDSPKKTLGMAGYGVWTELGINLEELESQAFKLLHSLRSTHVTFY